MTVQGEIRSFNFSAGAIKTSGLVRFSSAQVSQLKNELSGSSEYKVLSVSYTWEPMVTPNSDSGMVGIVGAPTTIMLDSLPTDIDSLLRAGMSLRPASTRRSVQVGSGAVEFVKASEAVGGVYVHCTKPGTAELGRISGVATIRVRGIGA